MSSKISMKQVCAVIALLLLLTACGINTKKTSNDVTKVLPQTAIREKAETVAKQIEIYLHSNPDKTIADLQNDDYFQQIAVQKVGETGYTAVTEYDTMICRFHANPAIVNMDLHNLAEKLPGFWNIMSKSQGGRESQGLYDWVEFNGTTKQKYMYIAVVNEKTADGVGLNVAATTYLDEYETQPTIELDKIVKDSVLRNIRNAKNIFYQLQKEDEENLQRLLTEFMDKEEYKSVFLKKDREQLYEFSKELFNQNKKNSDVTHFYYHELNGTNFLRVHNKDIYGDQINRITFNKAVQSNDWGTGIELGKTAFALRAVHPYTYNNQTIGYVEFGKEIDHYLAKLESETKNQYGILVKKEFLDENDWASVRRTNKKRNNYNDFKDYVLIDSSEKFQVIFENLDLNDADWGRISNQGDIIKKFKLGDNTYILTGFSLYDAGGRIVGAVVSIQDITIYEESSIAKFQWNIPSLIIIVITGLYFLLMLFSVSSKHSLSRYAYFIITNGILITIVQIFHSLNGISALSYRLLIATYFLLSANIFLITLALCNFQVNKKIENLYYAICAILSGLVIFTNLFAHNILNLEGTSREILFTPVWIMICILIISSLIVAYARKKQNLIVALFGIGIYFSYWMYRGMKGSYNPVLMYLYPIIVIGLISYPLVRTGIIKLKKNSVMIILQVTLILIIGLFIANTYQTTEIIKNQRIDTVVNQLTSIAESKESLIEYSLEQQKSKIEIAATDESLSSEELKEIQAKGYEFIELMIIDQDGIIIDSSNKTSIGQDKSNDQYFINAKKGTYVKPVYYSETIHRDTLAVSTPFYDKVLVARLNPDILGRITSDNAGMGNTGETLLAYRTTDGNAKFFTKRRFESGSPWVISKNNLEIPITQALRQNEAVFMEYNDYRNEPVIAITRYIDYLDVGLVTKIDKAEVLLPVRQTINKIWIFTGGMVLAILAIGIIFNVLITKSLRNEIRKRTTILEQKDKQLQTANTKLKELDKQKDAFISIAAHELKTPLTSIKSFTQLLFNNKILADKKKSKHYLELINKNTERLYNLVIDLVDSSRINLGQIKVNIETINVKDIFQETKENMEPIITEKGIKAVFRMEKGLPPIKADTARVLQVLKNLIINAVHYTDQGQISLTVTKKQDYALFVVADTGQGIPKDNQKDVFSRFYQVDSSLKRKIGGSGLGLSVCQGLVEIMKGKIWLTSTEGKGSTFYFTIPLARR